ncbi:OmpA family protein [Massilia antarctica]|uniref:OmpA family protein n=1 Tax=Massilia antarctica TaxID=2765360 RepID=UPI0006BB98EF|nr:OmpA family protein [Massilia sp. H27-R4]MCY0915521.1 OmpA family protein [Massilia sp. H27-R4]CUI04128.1 Outer membrane lipoprotein omp16 precursor [Janthinobacterium sp. CG23_2]CUU27914.1 Outer membrane lipoprotein omp16 precursor [Janthinobacterium sp. CG23_2]
MKKNLSTSLIGITVAVMLATGCADMSPTQRGTATGAGVGAGLGAIIGASSGHGGHAGKGAIIGGAAGAIIGNIWSNRMEQQKQAMEQATRGTGIQVSQTQDNRLKLEVPADVSFDTGRSDIKSNFRPVLERFAATLQDNPSTTVTIIGHTDSTGGDNVNQPLSVDRAAQTRDFLAARGVSPNRIMIDGRGEREPIASNDDPSGRARNRRVEIYVAEQDRHG